MHLVSRIVAHSARTAVSNGLAARATDRRPADGAGRHVRGLSAPLGDTQEGAHVISPTRGRNYMSAFLCSVALLSRRRAWRQEVWSGGDGSRRTERAMRR